MALLSKKTMNFAYGMGAAVVIVGALFKIQHWTGASAMLIIGLGVEALIFGLSAFDPVDTELDWSLVYPELAGGQAKEKTKKVEDPKDAQGLLSQKLDAMLKDLSVSVEHMARDQKMRLDWLPHYTSSIEAVVALIAGKLPDWSGYHDTGPNLAQYKAAVGSPGRPSTSPRCTIWATGKTPALALLSAALLAIHERNAPDE